MMVGSAGFRYPNSEGPDKSPLTSLGFPKTTRSFMRQCASVLGDSDGDAGMCLDFSCIAINSRSGQ